MRQFILGIAVVASVFIPIVAEADNLSCPGAIVLVPDGGTYSSTLTDTDPRWFRFVAKAGRSYAVMSENLTPVDIQPLIRAEAFYSNCSANGLPAGTAVTPLSYAEPVSADTVPNVGAGRYAVVPSADTTVYFTVTGAGGNFPGGNYSIRIEDTTLFSNWYFAGGDYMAFTLVRNTTNQSVNYTMKWRNNAGTIVATYTGTLPPNGSAYKNGADFPAAVAAVSGTVEVAHDGTPDAVVASTTVLSPTTGLSFDAPFIRRRR